MHKSILLGFDLSKFFLCTTHCLTIKIIQLQLKIIQSVGTAAIQPIRASWHKQNLYNIIPSQLWARRFIKLAHAYRVKTITTTSNSNTQKKHSNNFVFFFFFWIYFSEQYFNETNEIKITIVIIIMKWNYMSPCAVATSKYFSFWFWCSHANAFNLTIYLPTYIHYTYTNSTIKTTSTQYTCVIQ